MISIAKNFVIGLIIKNKFDCKCNKEFADY